MMRQSKPKKSRVNFFLILLAVSLLSAAVLLSLFLETPSQEATGEQGSAAFLLRFPVLRQTKGWMADETSLAATPPQLEVTGDLEFSMGQTDRMFDGVLAFDDADGDLTHAVTWHGNINFYKAQEYHIVYRVENSAGRVATESRRVRVVDPFARMRQQQDIRHSDEPDIYHLLYLTLNTLAEKTSNFSVYYLDLNTQDFFAINADRQYRSASTAKIFAVMALYEDIAAGRFELEQEIYYTPDDYEGGSGILKHMNLEQPYSLKNLADYAIMKSDNIAFHMIIRTVGRDRVYDYYESVIGHATDRRMTEMSAADAMHLLRHLYQSDNPYFDRMIHAMKHTVFEDALPGMLPDHIAANKIGFFRDYFHDVAIVDVPQAPYILAVFSEGVEAEHQADPKEIITWLSRMIYENR